ncbi:MAG TPA: IS4 family transposase [Candidatus Angelobacter sp.]|nr:IS4 family transposase [Candidatus Angelobacter sp.]
MSTPLCSTLRRNLQSQLQHLHSHLQQTDLDSLARQSRFRLRAPRKVPFLQWVLALVALAAETTLSLERVAAVIALAAGTPYSKQALHQRLGPKLEGFLAQIATTLFSRLALPTQNQGWFKSFRRVLLHDSTVEPLPEHLASAFPGPANHRKRRYASLKLQFVCDLLNSQVLHVGLSGFTRNDQAASPDILCLLQPGDLLIRDLGYFVLKVFQQIDLLGAFFLSRYRHDVCLFDPGTGQPIDLAGLLRPGQSFDQEVLLGKDKVRVRLVAQPVAQALGDERRRKAKSNRDRRLNPSKRKLYLLGWNIFVTNVPRSVWPAKALQPIYRLRWRIEIIFKAWKSHLGLRQLNCRSASLLRLSVLTKLLFCIAVYRLCDALEWTRSASHHVSLLRLARILGQCACWFAAQLLGLSVTRWLQWHLQHHLFYERRKDRSNFYELLSENNPH